MGQMDQVHSIERKIRWIKKSKSAKKKQKKRQSEALIGLVGARYAVHKLKDAPKSYVWTTQTVFFIILETKTSRMTHGTCTRDTRYTRPNVDDNIPQTCPWQREGRVAVSRAVPKRCIHTDNIWAKNTNNTWKNKWEKRKGKKQTKKHEKERSGSRTRVLKLKVASKRCKQVACAYFLEESMALQEAVARGTHGARTQSAQTWMIMYPKLVPLHREPRVTTSRVVFNEMRMSQNTNIRRNGG